jgi:hypothetical protein
MTERYTFAPRHLHLLARVRTGLEAVGCTCTVEVTTTKHFGLELHTLVVERPRREHPIVFTRAT